jgi:hypothetical protein
MTGYLPAGDVDVFRFDSASPSEIDVVAEAPDRVDIVLEWLRKDGTVLARTDSGGPRETERLPNLFADPGPGFIRLTSKVSSRPRARGNLDEPYRLRVTARDPAPGAEREPNDTEPAATPILADAAATGRLFPDGDVDLWRWDGPESSGVPPVGAAVRFRGIPRTTLEVRVFGRKLRKDILRFSANAEETSKLLPAPAPGDACCLFEVRGQRIKDGAKAKVAAPAGRPDDTYSLRVMP